ncbi:uncharacterized protein LOC132714397 [Ruditapes philippinarum]|uniref:uncharacterized protein LOC132714397 n=1 Tax=Ruditapes philippinarum TaxID=129788 RepID=UPI00295A9D9F|nr:uncharacterized protein LOC132714397 [Ruditapes philippinarum]
MEIRKICVQIFLAELTITPVLVISYLYVIKMRPQLSPMQEIQFKYQNGFWKKRILTNAIQYKSGRVLSDENLENIKLLSVNQCKNRRFLVYKCDGASLCGGTGDRQKGIVSAFLLSLLTNRTFIVDMTKPCNIETVLQVGVYNWSLCKGYIKTLPKQDIMKLNLLFGNRSVAKQIENIDFDSQWTAKVVLFRCNSLLIDKIRRHNYTETRLNWLQNTTNEETIHKVLHTLFQPNQRILEDFVKLYNKHVHGKNLVCSHIRIGKNPTIPKDEKLLRGSPNVTRILEFLKRYDDPKKYTIYIATDSDSVKQDAKSNLTSYVNINRPIVHVDRRMNESVAEACEGLYTGIFEQFILSLCDTLVLTRSSFGCMSAYMRGVQDNIFLYNPNLRKVGQYNLTEIQRVFKLV